ncbi:expressed unknown protein [Seminavis robusta]|uniref:Farnesoic acid O-methyl transferase domain-containing protein n=1 Tax=Seminavis robusta TaxID=568900 RepID=A0A9N8HZV5_9STRA|nr:expressed unknown protein [Seminavis robusta]|eukprot:Sro2397_g326070.1 n/a (727) ;mRNA; f:6811-9296
MAHRQVETTSVHSSAYHSGWIRISEEGPWEVVAHNNNGTENVLPCTYLDLATQINMQKSSERSKKYPRSLLRWNKDWHFNENLNLPPEKGILVLFEAMASEGVAVALSSQPGYQRGGTVEITFGAVGNTKATILKRNAPNSNPAVSQVSSPCRVCQETTWTSFWIARWKGKTYAGLGNAPGQKCLAVLDEEKKDEDATIEDNDDDKPSNETSADNNDTIDEDNAAANESTQQTKIGDIRYVGLANAAQQGRPVKIRNLYVTQIPTFVADVLEITTDSTTMDVLMDGSQPQPSLQEQQDNDEAAFKAYQEECRKAKARAEKFGTAYKEPDMASVLPWSQTRKFRANPLKAQGFITGIDVTDPAELAKQEARKSRFGDNTKKRELEEDATEEAGGEDPPAKDAATGTKMEESNDEDSIPIIQAWDNEELVRFQRVDPPESLWAKPPAETAESKEPPADEFAMETDKPTLTPEKIHIFSIDWSAFKQIRSEDLMAYFTVYGPSYVEWLGDLGCNILFEDKFSAVRAMQAMAEEIPSPPPSGLNEDDEDYVPPDFGAMGWKLGKNFVRKVKNDRFGKRGTIARILMRPATSLDILVERPNTWPDPPPGFSTRRILGPGDDYRVVNEDEEDDNQHNNRRKKRRRRNSDGDNRNSYNNNNSNNHSSNNNNDGGSNRNKNGATGKRRQRGEDSTSSQPSAKDRLNQGLSSGRAGFSVEEMEALRAAKKNTASK